MRTMKSLVDNADVNVHLTTALDNERKLFAPTWGGAVQRRALAANFLKRPLNRWTVKIFPIFFCHIEPTC